MARWEYRTVAAQYGSYMEVGGSVDFYGRPKPTRRNAWVGDLNGTLTLIDRVLDQLGDQGWELVGVAPGTDPNNHVLYLKRARSIPLPSGAPSA